MAKDQRQKKKPRKVKGKQTAPVRTNNNSSGIQAAITVPSVESTAIAKRRVSSASRRVSSVLVSGCGIGSMMVLLRGGSLLAGLYLCKTQSMIFIHGTPRSARTEQLLICLLGSACLSTQSTDQPGLSEASPVTATREPDTAYPEDFNSDKYSPSQTPSLDENVIEDSLHQTPFHSLDHVNRQSRFLLEYCKSIPYYPIPSRNTHKTQSQQMSHQQWLP